jgi:dTDP-glucose 4,6-dehydratase
MKNCIIVTGAAGFIGSNFVLNLVNIPNGKAKFISLDKLTYAGNFENLRPILNHINHKFIKGDINDEKILEVIFNKEKPRAIINFAAESHVDRSIKGPAKFIRTNIFGTYKLLEQTRKYYEKLKNSEKAYFRFLHISTDEVYGSLKKNEKPFSEKNNYLPNSPYSASKASSDHLVRAWKETYDIPVITTNCSNNYGPYQFPEKLIPLCIINAINDKPLPIYGDGKQIRDWLYVQDHCNAINLVLKKGKVGETYNIGGGNERTNLQVVNLICEILDKILPKKNKLSYKKQITFVNDRPGHDRRYAINARKIKTKLNWKPKENFNSGIIKTIQWYLSNKLWVKNIQNGEYMKWINKHYKK